MYKFVHENVRWIVRWSFDDRRRGLSVFAGESPPLSLGDRCRRAYRPAAGIRGGSGEASADIIQPGLGSDGPT